MTRARDVANIDGILTTTGDTYYASAAGTPARLGIGSTGNVLTVSGGVPAWSAPAGGGTTITLLGSQALTGLNTTTFSGISGKSWLYLVVLGAQNTSNADDDYIKINANATGANYNFQLSQTNGSGGLTKVQTTSNANGFQMTNSSTAASTASFSLWLNGCSGTSVKTGAITSVYTSSTSFQRIGTAQYLDTTTVTSMTLSRTGGDLWTAGTAYLYGG